MFGWTCEDDEKPSHYTTTKVDANLDCGIFGMSQTQLSRSIPLNWAMYFNVKNLDSGDRQSKRIRRYTINGAN